MVVSFRFAFQGYYYSGEKYDGLFCVNVGVGVICDTCHKDPSVGGVVKPVTRRLRRQDHQGTTRVRGSRTLIYQVPMLAGICRNVHAAILYEFICRNAISCMALITYVLSLFTLDLATSVRVLYKGSHRGFN